MRNRLHQVKKRQLRKKKREKDHGDQKIGSKMLIKQRETKGRNMLTKKTKSYRLAVLKK